ncbi:sn-glycerol 3-phosphate transport system permease protein [Rhizobium aethiopicum]|uniref:sn-glycerol-3-phosphate transport system permease protein UgpE n=1 Tax=Rhizobium aethiopicum TaxID=1138170 RepID=A0A7W6Q6K5_9HYPH|nr:MULTISPECIES: ABC transporter permease subunit [Rhizobium]MBB4190563.1 sn-glycerol 3-phosphate transport system permease protein [Rhizobium aethiopicum]MBB4577752.1 sn-glycerol 3-phosphate transport system permease protein [Rhizobium aethiopicum]MDO3431101.1 ABC transporter permease subunit [Rhizobium sp. CBN3]
MIERTPIFNFVCYTLLALGMVIALLPFVIVIIASTLDLETVNRVPLPLMPSSHFWENAKEAWIRADLGNKLIHSIIFATSVATGKVILSAMAAFSIVYFRFRGRHLIFWIIFITLMLPLEVRIVPTYSIAANALAPFQAILDVTGITALVAWVSGIQIKLEWGLLNSYTGLVAPLVATATGTFLYRQFYLTVPDELAEATKMDGAGAVRFFVDILLPLSRSNMIALFTIMFVWAWNQYLWPLLVTTDPNFGIAVTQLKTLIPSEFGLPDWNVAMAGTLIIMSPPLLLVILMQRWFVRGLISTEK